MSDARRANLDTAVRYYQFLEDTEQEERWAAEKLEEVKVTAVGKDLDAGLKLLKKHEVTHWPRPFMSFTRDVFASSSLSTIREPRCRQEIFCKFHFFSECIATEYLCKRPKGTA